MCGELSRRRPVPSSPRTGLGQSKTMAHITEEHLHHMAKRHHATMQKLDGLRERISHYTRKSFGAIETGFGSFAGGLLEGRTQNMPGLGRLPVNLILGAGLLAAGYANVGGERYSSHWNNLGNGFIGSYLASAGYAFGKRWADTGKVFGGGAGNPLLDPYGNGWSKGPAAAPPPPPPAPPAPAMGW